MDEVSTRELRTLDIDGDKRGRKQDYRDRLTRTSWASLKAEGGNVLADPCCTYAERVRALSQAAGRDTTVFQAVVVASLQTLNRVLERQRQAAVASISLAQGEKLRAMVESTEAMTKALTEALSKQGSKMLHLCNAAPARRGDPSWWFALTETIQALEEGMERMGTIVYGQPKGGPARTLSSLVIRLMHHQHLALLAEAEHWIS